MEHNRRLGTNRSHYLQTSMPCLSIIFYLNIQNRQIKNPQYYHQIKHDLILIYFFHFQNTIFDPTKQLCYDTQCQWPEQHLYQTE